jgi:hypothetical protein
MGDRPIPDIGGPLFDVTSAGFGALPGDGIDDTAAIQAAIESAGAAGGGVVFLPKGRYEIHQTSDAPFLHISHDNVILRGQGAESSGTILHLGAPGPAKAIRRLGSVPAEQEARHWAAVAVMGAEDMRELTSYTRSIPRGERVIGVRDSARLRTGQTVVIEFHDPLISAGHPDPKKADIAAQLTYPFRLVESQTDTFGSAAQNPSLIVKVEEVCDGKTVRLAEPARFDQFERYNPRIFSFDGVHGVGIEHLRIESSWPGDYRHHKPCVGTDGAVVRTAKEQDYLWNGLWISYASDGWVRDCAFKDLTQGIIVSHSAYLTIEDVRFEGLDGHAGITIGWSNGILVRRADFFSRMVHPITLTMMASGNVVSDCEAHYEGRDAVSATDAVIDFHGLFPYENLFENLRGFYVCPGGDLSILPHAGVRNVFWNILAPRRMECYTCGKDDEFVRTYDYQSTSSGTPKTMFEHLPQTFFIGIQRKADRVVTVGGSTVDRHNEWMTVEGLNRPGIAVPSLYEAQRCR